MSFSYFSQPGTGDYNSLYELQDSLPTPSLDKFQETYKKLGMEYPYGDSYNQRFKTFDIGTTTTFSDAKDNINQLKKKLYRYDEKRNRKGLIEYGLNKSCYYIDPSTHERYRIPCALAHIIIDAYKFSDKPQALYISEEKTKKN
jgi:hypothetical protein